MRRAFRAADLVIPNAGQNSNALSSDDSSLFRSRGFAIQAPAALTGVVTLEVSLDGGSTFGTLQSGGADVEVAAGKVVLIDFSAFTDLRVHSASAEAAERTFFIMTFEDF